MAILPVGIGPQEGGYQIERSLRFNSADSAYLSRTPGSAGSLTTWTYSTWVKRAALGAWQRLIHASSSGLVQTHLSFASNDTIWLEVYNDPTDYKINTTQVFRDVGAWYHIVAVYDSNNATSSDRMRLYVNGARITALSTAAYPTSGYSGLINSTSTHNIGRRLDNTSEYLSAYLSETHLIDGSALTPSSFGEYNTDTGVWQPKAYTGSYGTNGFYLDFADNSSTTALGYDAAGSNDWTPNNFSVTAGAGNDSLVDTPTPYGTDTGAGGEVRGNYCTWNSVAQSTVVNGTVTRSNGNLESTDGSTTYGLASFGTIAVSSGKWYWETTLTSAGGTYGSTGVVDLNSPLSAGTHTGIIYAQGGNKSSGSNVFTGSGSTAYGATYTAGDVIGVALNLDAGEITFYKNGVSQGVAYTGISGNYAPGVGDGQNSTSYTWTLNAGQRPFAYSAPSGFKALCTQNLPEPTVVDGGEYFNTVLWTGNGTTQNITGVGFQPDFVWAKKRSGAESHGLYDAVRGASNRLVSNSTAAAVTDAGVSAFLSDGFSISGADSGVTNDNAATYVAWNWKANGTGVTNTAGSITSTVSANTTAGFSIVNWTGSTSTSAQTVGHGLGVTPKMVILKNRDSADNWWVYHASVTSTSQNLYLNTTAALTTQVSALWGAGMTSTLVGVRPATFCTATSDDVIMYVFSEVAGYSRFGSYTGNGSTDGPMIWTGFRPAFVMIKSSSYVAPWVIHDAARNTYNVVNLNLSANTSNAEGTYDQLDFLSNGFKIKNTGANLNTSGGTLIYMAFAESPFKYSLGR